jgi:hypothetical protein
VASGALYLGVVSLTISNRFFLIFSGKTKGAYPRGALYVALALNIKSIGWCPTVTNALAYKDLEQYEALQDRAKVTKRFSSVIYKCS